MLGQNVFIGQDVVIGEFARIYNNVSVYSGVTLCDHVFVGPSVVFTNDLSPRVGGDWTMVPTLVKCNASIGANSTIRCGVIIGEGAMVGCGSVVLHDVPDGETWAGNPARKIS